MKVSTMTILSLGACVTFMSLSSAFSQPAPLGSRQEALAWVKGQLNGKTKKSFDGTSSKGLHCALYVSDTPFKGMEDYTVVVGSDGLYIGLFTSTGIAAGTDDTLDFYANTGLGNDIIRFSRVSIILKDRKPIRVYGRTDRLGQDIDCSINP